MYTYKWQIENKIALEKETNASFNVNVESEYADRFKQFISDGGIVENATIIPEPSKKWTPYEFRNKFTQAERINILNSSDPMIKDLWSGFSTAQEIIADNEETILGMDYLVASGIIDEKRKMDILA